MAGQAQPFCMQAFCAGGDVKGAVLSARDGRPHDAMDFFRTEYGELNVVEAQPDADVQQAMELWLSRQPRNLFSCKQCSRRSPMPTSSNLIPAAVVSAASARIPLLRPQAWCMPSRGSRDRTSLSWTVSAWAAAPASPSTAASVSPRKSAALPAPACCCRIMIHHFILRTTVSSCEKCGAIHRQSPERSPCCRRDQRYMQNVPQSSLSVPAKQQTICRHRGDGGDFYPAGRSSRCRSAASGCSRTWAGRAFWAAFPASWAPTLRSPAPASLVCRSRFPRPHLLNQ